MVFRRNRFVIGNWKMNPASPAEARKLFDAIKRKTAKARKTQVVVCPPMLYLGDIALRYSGTSLALGAQDISVNEKVGKYTGEISGQMLKNSGVTFAIVGHSERRELGEIDTEVASKARVSLRAGLMTVLCVGEGHRDTSGKYLRFVETQIQNSLHGVGKPLVGRLLLAYEPLWAIGKSSQEAMKPQEVYEMSLFIRKILVKIYGRKQALRIPVLYGGSVEPGNVEALVNDGAVEGFLVGHASRVAEDFANIVKASEKG